MKIKNKKRLKPQSSNNNLKSSRDPVCEDNLDRVAEELVVLARNRLRNNVLSGVLSGMEDDIRQDAILLALSWYLRIGDTTINPPEYPWHAPRAIAAALQIQKKEYARRRHAEIQAVKSMPADKSGELQHPALMHRCDWPPSVLQTLMRKAIQVALKGGLISHANARIALWVYVDLIPTIEVAKRLNVHRSSVYQHLSRVRREIPDIIDGIEVPLHELS